MVQRRKATQSTKKVTRTKRLERQARGAKADAAGLRYEQLVSNYFSRSGWKLSFRKKKYGYEYDIYGEREELLSGPEYLLVECKDKARVSAKDVVRFISKVDTFYKHLPQLLLFAKPAVHAYLCYSGSVDNDAANVAKSHKPPIKLKKM